MSVYFVYNLVYVYRSSPEQQIKLVLIAASLVAGKNYVVEIKVFHQGSLSKGCENISKTVLILNTTEKAHSSILKSSIQWFAYLLSLWTSLAALHTMLTL